MVVLDLVAMVVLDLANGGGGSSRSGCSGGLQLLDPVATVVLDPSVAVASRFSLRLQFWINCTAAASVLDMATVVVLDLAVGCRGYGSDCGCSFSI